jgi:serpin B
MVSGGERIVISEAFHKAFVDVNEEGTEAAAATGLVMRATAMQAAPQVFNADHPFMFVIRENQSGAVLFMGRVVDPRS